MRTPIKKTILALAISLAGLLSAQAYYPGCYWGNDPSGVPLYNYAGQLYYADGRYWGEFYVDHGFWARRANGFTYRVYLPWERQ